MGPFDNSNTSGSRDESDKHFVICLDKKKLILQFIYGI